MTARSRRVAPRWHARRAARVRALLLLPLLTFLLASCDIGYYWQAANGEMAILNKRRPIAEVLQDPKVSEATKAKLRLVLAVQTFGIETMALPAKGAYTTYADLGRPQVTWLVVASEPFRIQAVEQCYWIVGCLEYRGYFAREDADAFAESLRAEGKDVLVRPVRAYSTLGWFNDPVLNTFLLADDVGVMGTILHEQAHRALFVKGDTAFNESFAVFVEQEGVARFLAGKGERGAALLKQYRQAQADEARFREIVLRGKARLEALYASGKPEPEMRREKAEAFAAMRRDYENERGSFILLNYDAWFAQPLNNANLVSIEQYESRVKAFAALFRENGEDFARFLAAAKQLAELPEAERNAGLDALEQGT